MIKPRVLFLCTDNSCRTQMAEGFLRHLAGDRFDVASAGCEATDLDPDAVEAMREAGVDISGHRAKPAETYFGQQFTFVITLCSRETENTCPIFPGGIWRLQWPIENPHAQRAVAEHKASVRRARDLIHQQVLDFINAHG
ncbi:MAG: arsenate reductase ArsC [Bryobacteraceae bacterium]